MIPLKINNNQYYFNNVPDREDSYARSIFYKEIIKEKLFKKRKYFFFGKVISEKIVKKTSLEYCFSFIPINLNIFPNYDDTIFKLKIAEENYQRKSNLLDGKISI
jgi:hypothetical protein